MCDNGKSYRVIYNYMLIVAGAYLCLAAIYFLLGKLIFGVYFEQIYNWGLNELASAQHTIGETVIYNAKIRALKMLLIVIAGALAGLVPGAVMLWKKRTPKFLSGLFASDSANKSLSSLCGCGVLLLLFCWLVDYLQRFLWQVALLVPTLGFIELSGENKLLAVSFTGVAIPLLMQILIVTVMFVIKKHMRRDAEVAQPEETKI